MKSRLFASLRVGATPTPQLPVMTVVTPFAALGATSGSHMHCASCSSTARIEHGAERNRGAKTHVVRVDVRPTRHEVLAARVHLPPSFDTERRPDMRDEPALWHHEQLMSEQLHRARIGLGAPMAGISRSAEQRLN